MPVTFGGGINLDRVTRLRLGYIYENQEVRCETPATLPNNFAYYGVAPDGSATSSTTWDIMRVSYDSLGRRSREQFKLGISWDNRAIGW